MTTCSCELEHDALVGQCIGQARVPGPLHSLDDSEGDDYWATGEEQGGNASEVYVDDANAGAWDDWDEAAAISTNCQDYIQAKAFSGPIQGYLFRTGRSGLGCYRDLGPGGRNDCWQTGGKGEVADIPSSPLAYLELQSKDSQVVFHVPLDSLIPRTAQEALGVTTTLKASRDAGPEPVRDLAEPD